MASKEAWLLLCATLAGFATCNRLKRVAASLPIWPDSDVIEEALFGYVLVVG
jgi:hypothetical protein